MKLYFSQGACSLSPHIALREAGLPFTLESVDLRAKKTGAGADFKAVNPKGYVPVLELPDGQRLTEGPAIVQYIADQRPEARLAPPAGTMERYRLQEWLNFISSEIHKTFSPLFYPQTPEEWKHVLRERLAGRFEQVDAALDGRPFLCGETFTVADGYLYTVLRWAKPFNELDLARWPNLKAYFERVNGRPAVRAAVEAERPRNQ